MIVNIMFVIITMAFIFHSSGKPKKNRENYSGYIFP